MTYISGDDPPFLIFHGTFDCVATPQSSVELEKRLKETGIPVNIHLLTHAVMEARNLYRQKLSL